MGKTKKVILFIVEGITDKTALGSVLDAILSNEKIHFAITEGDITTKDALADQFDDLYGDAPEAFLEFIKSKDFAVPGDYAETWNFIEDGVHSLERWSNFHLYFE